MSRGVLHDGNCQATSDQPSLAKARPIRAPFGGRPIVIIGAGAVGLCCAYSLSRRGAQVILIDRSRVGDGCSWGNGGWICPVDCRPLPEPGVPRFALRSLLTRNSPIHFKATKVPGLAPWIYRFWRQCNQSAFNHGLEALARLARPTFRLLDQMITDGVQFELHRQGMIYATRKADDALAALRRVEPMQQWGYSIPDEIITGDELHDLEPALGDEIRAGFLIEEFWHLRPEAFTSALKRTLTSTGVCFLEHTTVHGFSGESQQLTAVQTDSGDVCAGAVVICAGAVSGQLTERLGFRLPLQAGKGYSFIIHPRTVPNHAIDFPDIHVGCSPYGDEVRISGTMEFSGFNTTLDARRVDQVVGGARRSLADWQDEQVKSLWAGMRPVTSDGLPILDRTPTHSNAFVATGHAMQGVHLAPVTGEHMADLIMTGERPQVLEPFRVDRFKMRVRPVQSVS